MWLSGRDSHYEVAAICAHELAHLTKSKGTLGARFIGSLWFVPWLFFRSIVSAHELGGFLALMIVTLILIQLSRHLSQKLESRADRIARSHEADL